MSDAAKPPVAPDCSTPSSSEATPRPGSPEPSAAGLWRSPAGPATDPVRCERCGGAQVYRMHAVWRCADCGYKTDCCGW